MSDLRNLIGNHWQLPAAGVGLVLLLLLALAVRRVAASAKAAGSQRASGAPFWLFITLAVGCTVFSTITSYRYLSGASIGLTRGELYGTFCLIELALAACGFGARQNLNDPEIGSPGAPGTAIWCIVALAAIPAFSVSHGDVFAAVFRLAVGPVGAVFAFHAALGMELRHRKPGSRSQGRFAQVREDLIQRLMAVFGLGARNMTAQELTRERARKRAARLSARLGNMGRSGGWRFDRVSRRLDDALRRAEVASRPEQAAALLDELAVSRNRNDLATLVLRSPWEGHAVVLGRRGEDGAESGPGPFTAVNGGGASSMVSLPATLALADRILLTMQADDQYEQYDRVPVYLAAVLGVPFQTLADAVDGLGGWDAVIARAQERREDIAAFAAESAARANRARESAPAADANGPEIGDANTNEDANTDANANDANDANDANGVSREDANTSANASANGQASAVRADFAQIVLPSARSAREAEANPGPAPAVQVVPVDPAPGFAPARADLAGARAARSGASVRAIVAEARAEFGDDTMVLRRVVAERLNRPVDDVRADTIREGIRAAKKAEEAAAKREAESRANANNGMYL